MLRIEVARIGIAGTGKLWRQVCDSPIQCSASSVALVRIPVVVYQTWQAVDAGPVVLLLVRTQANLSFLDRPLGSLFAIVFEIHPWNCETAGIRDPLARDPNGRSQSSVPMFT